MVNFFTKWQNKELLNVFDQNYFADKVPFENEATY